MMNEAKMTELTQAEDMAYFRAYLCLYSPESYSMDEKKEICNDMMSTSKEAFGAQPDGVEQGERQLALAALEEVRPVGRADEDHVTVLDLWVAPEALGCRRRNTCEVACEVAL